MVQFIVQALPAIISAVTLGLVSWIVRKVSRLLKDFVTLKDSQRNQLKADIVEKYERAKERGYITPMELDTANRVADSYFALGGNHYVHAIIAHLNNDMEIKGESIPD